MEATFSRSFLVGLHVGRDDAHTGFGVVPVLSVARSNSFSAMLENIGREFDISRIVNDLKIGNKSRQTEVRIDNERTGQETASPANRPVGVCQIRQIEDRHVHDVHADIAMDDGACRHVMACGRCPKIPDRRFTIFKITVAGAETRTVEDREAFGLDVTVLSP